MLNLQGKYQKLGKNNEGNGKFSQNSSHDSIIQCWHVIPCSRWASDCFVDSGFVIFLIAAPFYLSIYLFVNHSVVFLVHPAGTCQFIIDDHHHYVLILPPLPHFCIQFIHVSPIPSLQFHPLLPLRRLSSSQIEDALKQAQWQWRRQDFFGGGGDAPAT